MSNKLTQIAKEILIIESDIRFRLNYDRSKSDYYVSVDDFDMYTFEQIWGTTSLGFSGVGGSAITEARTYVFIPRIDNQPCIVYFAGQFAYAVPYSKVFMEDVKNHNMEPQYKIYKYKATVQDNKHGSE
jgi:hypothetical protein